MKKLLLILIANLSLLPIIAEAKISSECFSYDAKYKYIYYDNTLPCFTIEYPSNYPGGLDEASTKARKAIIGPWLKMQADFVERDRASFEHRIEYLKSIDYFD